MPLELWENPSYLDIIRVRIETRDSSGLVDPLYVDSVSVWNQDQKIHSLGTRPWIDGEGPLFKDSTGQFYFDFNPYRYGVRKECTLTVKWEYMSPEGLSRQSSNFSLTEAVGIELPKEINENLRHGDRIRLRFTIQDSSGNLVDPEYINRLVIYQTQRGGTDVDLDSKAIYTVKGENQTDHIWTKSSYLSGSLSEIIRESEGDFYYDWDTINAMVSPGSLIAVLFYRLPSTISLIKGNSLETYATEFVLSPTLRTNLLSETEFSKMFERFIPHWFLDQPELETGKESVSKRIIQAFGKGWKELFDLGSGFTQVYDPDSLEPRCLPSLASNIGWNLKGIRPEGWRNQIKKANNIFRNKGSLEGLKMAIESVGGRLESLIRYWQVFPRHTNIDYIVIDESILSSHDLKTSKDVYLNSEPNDPYKFFKLKIRKILCRSSDTIKARVILNSKSVKIEQGTFITWGVQSGDKLKISIPGQKDRWYTINTILSETEILLTDRYHGLSSGTASFLVSRKDYEVVSQSSLIFEKVGTKVSRIHIDPTSGINLSIGDELLLLYQTSPMTDREESIEKRILDLPLLDLRDEREVVYPSKNFNARIIEDPNGIWYYEDPKKTKTTETHSSLSLKDETLPLKNSPIAHNDDYDLSVNSDYAFLPAEKKFVSAFGSFVKSDGVSSYFCRFALSTFGGEINEKSWVYSSGYNPEIESITLSDSGIIFSHEGVITQVEINYTWIDGQFTPKDKAYLVNQRDFLCPMGITDADRVVFGQRRTEFAYSENVYNMDEYNGSLRPSFDPCYIDPEFIDTCDCSPTTVIELSIRTPDLSERAIEEFEMLVREVKPFHSIVRSISFVGEFSDSIMIQDSLEVYITYGLEDNISFLNREWLRGKGVSTNRGDLIYLRSLSSDNGTPIEPMVFFYSETEDFLTAPANPNGILKITSGDTGEYHFRNPELRELEIVGLSAAPSVGVPQRFTIYNPISFGTAKTQDLKSLIGTTIFGLNPYSGAMLRPSSQTNSTIEFSGIDLMEDLNILVGDYLRVENGSTDFYRITELQTGTDGRYSKAIIEGNVDPDSIVSFWRTPIKDGIGWFLESYNKIQATNLPVFNEDSDYVISIGELVEERGEVYPGPCENGIRRGSYFGPISIGENFDSALSGYLGTLLGPYSSYGSFVINDEIFYFVTKGSGGEIGIDCDVYNLSFIPHDITEINLSEGGISFKFTTSQPTSVNLWYKWRDGQFHPVETFDEVSDIIISSGLSLAESNIINYELYELLETGNMFNPRGYTGSLQAPYSSYGSFEKSGVTYYFVTKDEGGVVGSMSGISPSGSGINEIWRRGETVEFDNTIGVTMLGVQLAPNVVRGELDSDILLVKVIPDFPYFININKQTLVENSYREIPLESDINKTEVNIEETLSVIIEDSGSTSTKVLY